MSQRQEKPTVVSLIACLGNLCRYCDCTVQEAEAVITFSYWHGNPFICHRECKDAGMKQEAFDCQSIDSDCNDCKHFRRGELIKRDFWDCGLGRMVSVNTEVWTGHCLKFDRETRAYPMKWTGRACFEHRRAQIVNT